MWSSIRLICSLLICLFLEEGCHNSALKAGKRADGSPVREVSDFNQVWPEIARELDVSFDGLQVTLGQLQGIGHVGFASKVKQLAVEKDQLNNQLQIFARTRYLSYINAEYDPDPASRQKGRESWDKAVDYINQQALDIRQKTLTLEIEGQKYLALERNLPKAKSNTESVRQHVQQQRTRFQEAAKYRDSCPDNRDCPDLETVAEALSKAVKSLQEAEKEEQRVRNEYDQHKEILDKVLEVTKKAMEMSLKAAKLAT